VINLPTIKVLVKRSFLTQDSADEYVFTEAYLVAVAANAGSALMFTVYTADGAIFSDLPIEALLCDRFGINDEIDASAYDTPELQPFTSLEGPVSVISYDLMKNARLVAKVAGDKVPAHYLFTLAYSGDGLAEDPEQSKTHNVVVLENGQLAALPNNMCLFIDNWFSTSGGINWPSYKRRHKYYRAGG
jgi:hypothetical protein